MPIEDFRAYCETFTLERYETEYADRHLLAGVIEKWARELPDKPAIINFDTGREHTYRQLDQVTTAWALKLIEMGYEPGDFLATFLPLLSEHIILEYACFKIGVIHAPLDLRLKGPEVVRSLSLVEPKGFAFLGRTSVADFRDIGRQVQQECPYVRHFLQFSPREDLIDGATSIFDFAASATSLGEDSARDAQHKLRGEYLRRRNAVKPEDGAQVIYTTGSTGFPKPALLSNRNITSQNMGLSAGFQMDGPTRQLVNLPPSHVGCQAEQLMTSFFSGNTAIILHVFDAEKTLQAVEKHRATKLGQIPAMFNMQWRLPNYSQYDLSSLDAVLFGGQSVTGAFVGQLKTMAPLIGTGLGLSEMAGFVTYTGLTDEVERLVNGVGWWLPITPLTIRKPMHADGTAGEELPLGETGEICFTGPQVFIDYVNNREAYDRTVSREGICYTGDLGYVSDHGLIFAGRAKLVIKPKGYQVYPAQIEDHFAGLKEHVAVCGAVGAVHDIYSEAVVLFVEQKAGAGLTCEVLETHAKGIAAYMRPSHYVILEPGSFPLNRTTKTDYVRLSEMAKAEVQRLRAAGGWDK